MTWRRKERNDIESGKVTQKESNETFVCLYKFRGDKNETIREVYQGRENVSDVVVGLGHSLKINMKRFQFAKETSLEAINFFPGKLAIKKLSYLRDLITIKT